MGMKVEFAGRQGVPCGQDERPLDDLIGEADAITLHLPLTAETRGLMNAQRLSRMKSSAVLVNTGRGALVDAAALADALRAGRIAGAAIDVLEVEPPPPSHPLMAADIPNLLLTPHVAWASEAAQARLASSLIAMIEDRRRAVAS
jgi:glycerate dehydrogenase